MTSVNVVMINGSGTGVTHAEMVACAAALTIQAQEHFALEPPFGYGISATVRVAAGPFDIKPHEWVLSLLQHPDIDNALGYHDITVHGKPLMKIFPLLDAQDGVRWETTASHELLETLADPNIAKCAESWDGKVWCYEVGDAVEATSYTINGVPMSNFVLPPYFEPVKSLVGLKLDWMGLVKKPLEILPGGYGQFLDPVKGWQQVLAQHPDGTHIQPRAYRQMAHGRGKIRTAKYGRKVVT